MYVTFLCFSTLQHIKDILGDSRNYMSPILVPSCTKRIAAQTVVIAKLNGKKKLF